MKRVEHLKIYNSFFMIIITVEEKLNELDITNELLLLRKKYIILELL